jgi:PAB-dependent poly(A)-specific ribonuclease subunit 2
MYGQSDASYWELGAIPAVNGEGISCIQFDCYEESLWVGTDAGTIAQFSSPDLTRHCTLPAHGHQSPIIDIVSLGGGLVSLSHNRICYHSSGGVPQLSHFSPEGDLSACLLDHHRGKLLVAKSSTGTLFNYDLHRGFVSDDIFLTLPDTTTDGNTDSSYSTTPVCPVFIKGPVSRGTLVIASANGQLHFIDPRNRYRPSKNPLLAHQAGFRALTTSGDLVATAGYALRRNQQPSLEPLVKVFDIRMTPRMLAAIPFAPGPHFMEPHPTLSSTLLVGSAEGIFTLADTQALNPGTFNRVETEGDALYSGALSLTGEMLAFGGSGGYVHLWTSNEQQGTVAGGVQYVEEVPALPEQPQVSIHDIDEELRVLGKEVPWYYSMDGTLASDYQPKEKYSVGMPPRKVDPELLKTGKVSDFVVYVENPHGSKKNKRSGGGCTDGEMVPGQAAAAAASIIGARIPLKYKDTSRRRHNKEEEEERAARAAKRAASGAVILPEHYRRVAIKRKPGDRFFFLDEFDFSSYNKSPYLGLENTIANCYMNALLQVLYFMQPMREVVLKQMPDAAAEFNLTDELGFLFRMLASTTGYSSGDNNDNKNDSTEGVEQVQGRSKDQTSTSLKVCQAANLFRALRQSKEAMALGLLEGVKGERMATDIEVEANKDRSLGRRVQTLSRFLLEQLNKEASAAVPPGLRSPIESIFGIIFRVKTQCIIHKREPQLKNSRAFQVELQYPSAKERSVYFSSEAIAAENGNGGGNDPSTTTTSNSAIITSSSDILPTTRPPSFVQVLQTSLLSKSDMRAWFDEELGYQHVTQTKCPVELPQVLIVSCGLQDRGDLIWWNPSTINTTTTTDTDGTTTTTKQWLPHSFNVKLDRNSWDISISETMTTTPTSNNGDYADTNGESLFTYDLGAVVAHVRDDEEVEDIGQDYEGHLLAHIKIPSRSDNEGKGEWHVFNDFAISPCIEHEVGELYGGQKAPALLFFIRRQTDDDVSGTGDSSGVGSPRTTPLPPPSPSSSNPIISPQRFLDLCSAPPLQALSPASAGRVRLRRPTFIPPGRNEIPIKGTILAIDAEFVQYSPAEKAVIRGMEVELRAARLGLARVSIIRGIGGPGGPGKGVPIIDDYIRSVEPVHDYLTKYSGLVPGDLDPSRSPHHLTTLKNAYLKLRYLVDVGCIFVGHGLKQDFRMLNIVVPPSQVIDTLDLFYLPQYRRKLGLRFLTSYLLKSNIQQGTHDSIEDARAALGLYEAYKQLVAAGEGVLESKLKEVYEWGGVHGFERVVWGADGQPHSMSEMEQVVAAAANQAAASPPAGLTR